MLNKMRGHGLICGSASAAFLVATAWYTCSKEVAYALLIVAAAIIAAIKADAYIEKIVDRLLAANLSYLLPLFSKIGSAFSPVGSAVNRTVIDMIYRVRPELRLDKPTFSGFAVVVFFALIAAIILAKLGGFLLPASLMGGAVGLCIYCLLKHMPFSNDEDGKLWFSRLVEAVFAVLLILSVITSMLSIISLALLGDLNDVELDYLRNVSRTNNAIYGIVRYEHRIPSDTEIIKILHQPQN